MSSPPPLPPKDKPTSPTSPNVSDQVKAKLLQGLPKPRDPTHSGSETPGGKVKDFFGNLQKKKSLTKKKSDSSTSTSKPPSTGTEDGKSDITTSPTATKGAVSVVPPPTPSTSASTKSPDNPFHVSLENAQRRVDRLNETTLVLNGLATVLSAGASWLPGVGEAVSVVSQMLEAAAKISVGRVSALRLVERSAAVLEAVEQAVIDNKGTLSPVIQKNINQLLSEHAAKGYKISSLPPCHGTQWSTAPLTVPFGCCSNIHDNNRFLVKLSERPFLKLYLHSDETTRHLTYATESLQDFVEIFHLQTEIAIAAWAEQSRRDDEVDMKFLITKLFDSLSSDQKMLETLSIQSESQQEAIKTLQRTLDQMLTLQQLEYTRHHPQTHPENDQPVATLSRFAKASIKKMSLDSIDTELSAFSFQPQGSGHSGLGGDIPLPRAITQPSYQTEEEDGLHRQFFEKALDVLRRTSNSTQAEVPDWTITNLEISHGELITHQERLNSGYFSVIWRGRWQNREVAIKELTPMADRKLFVKEVEVWRRLRSDYVLPFYGASSTTGPPPWFLVSPYMENGNILAYLDSEHGKEANKITLIHDIAQGLEYLHSREILHGDFKATNVLVNDEERALICDFGLSAMKMDYTTKSQEAADAPTSPAGTMRWQSPERLAGGVLTRENDVYAFGMAVYEIVSGQVPYGHIDDSQVRRNVKAGVYPTRPAETSDRLWTLVTKCWDRDPAKRPNFEQIVQQLGTMCSPISRKATLQSATTDTSSSSYTTASEGGLPENHQAISPATSTVPLPDLSDAWSSSSGSIKSIPAHLESQPSFESDRSERQYRHYLQHTFDDRLTLPLWFPSGVALGAVGYIRHGMFVQLLDAHRPPVGKDVPPLPYLDEFSSLQTIETTVNARGAADKALDTMAAITSFIRASGETSQKAIIRRIPFLLRPGMKQAALLIEDGHFEIYRTLSEARAYLSANIDWILHNFGDQHHLNKEDVIIVVGTLTAHNYAMMLSSFAPRTSLTFNVHASSSRSDGEPWGTWTVEREKPSNPSRSFRSRNEQPVRQPITGLEEQAIKYCCKVSRVSASPPEAVLLAKLRFAPGSTEPSLYA